MAARQNSTMSKAGRAPVLSRPSRKARSKDQVSEEELRQLVEEIGLWFERSGVPRMAGRVLGWLLLCDPAEQTMQQLADHLDASMGSISTMLRLLGQLGLIEKSSIPGERS